MEKIAAAVEYAEGIYFVRNYIFTHIFTFSSHEAIGQLFILDNYLRTFR